MKAKKNNPFVESVVEKLSKFGPVNSRAMFGAFGLWLDNVIFGIIVDCTLFFRVDESNKQDYVDHKSYPLTYEGKTKTITLPYWTVPDKVWKSPDTLKEWMLKSYRSSLRAPKKKKKKKIPQRHREEI